MIVFVSNKELVGSKTNITQLKSTAAIGGSLSKEKVIALDIETTGLSCFENDLLLVGVGTENYQIIVDVNGVDVYDFIYQAIEANPAVKVGANLSFDLKFLKQMYCADISNLWDVSKVDEVIFNGLFNNLHENATMAKKLYYKAFSLASICKRHLKKEMSKTVRNSFIGRNPNKPYTIEEIEYLANDLIIPLQIKKKQEILINKYGLGKVVELENNVVEVVAEMEFNGVKLDSKKWEEIAHKTEKRRAEVIEDLDRVLIDELKLVKYKNNTYQMDAFQEVVPRKSTVNWSSDSQALKVIQEIKPEIESTKEKVIAAFKTELSLIGHLLNYKELDKACSSYGLSFLKNINHKTDRIHPSIAQLFPTTGRMSMLKPNLQQVKRGSDYRSCFIADKGRKIMGFDYSNQELRIIAGASREPVWIKAFEDKDDLHSLLCELVFEIDRSSVKKPFPFNPKITYRDVQKTIDFMLAYGGSEHKLSAVTGMSVEKAREIIKKFFSIVPMVESYLESIGEFGVKNGYSRTLAPFGRIRWYPEFTKVREGEIPKDRVKMVMESIRRASKNAPIQGTGADMMKYAMVKIFRYLVEHNLRNDIEIILQVHDELLFSVKDKSVEEAKNLVTALMLEASKEIIPNVPMEVSCSIGDHWLK